MLNFKFKICIILLLFNFLIGFTLSDRSDGRLPKTIRPIVYNLRLRPDFYSNVTSNFKYNGTIDIALECREQTDQVVLNYDDEDGLIISDIRLVDMNGVDLLRNVTIDNEAEFLIVNSTRSLAVGERFWFSAKLNGKIVNDRYGFFWAEYDESNVGKRYMVTTFLVPKLARAIFPCFDEPSFKARVRLNIERKREYTALSTTPVLRTSDLSDGFVNDEFEWTPIMPLYSLCWAVVDFGYVESYTADGVRVRVYARRDRIDEANFALEMATKSLDYFGEKLDYNYTLRKLDNLAVPRSLGYAMEHWGLVTYTETSLLRNDETNTLGEKLRTAKLVMHELAHQWFGNLMTCDWWDDTWINEGITEYMQHIPLKTILGIKHNEEQILRDINTIKVSDGLNTSQPIIPNIPTVWDSTKGFSRITYNKGGALTRMLRSDLGEEKFWQRIQRALKLYQYKSITTDQLWDVLLPVENGDTLVERKRKWNTWMEQINYPLIKVTLDAKSGATIQQFHYLDPKDQIINRPSPHNYTWSIPISIVTPNRTSDETIRWLIHGTATLPEVAGEEWFLVNSQHSGYYRVDYDATLRSKISHALRTNFEKIPYENRALLIDDTFILARNDYYTEDVAMEFTRHMSQERERTVWETFFRQSEQIERLLGSLNETSNLIRSYMIKLIDPTYEDLGFDEQENDDLSIKLLRFEIQQRACNLNIGNCRDKARERFLRWFNAGEKPKPDITYTIACQGALKGTDNEWNFLYETGINENPNHRLSILRGLSCKDDKSTLQRYFEKLWNGSDYSFSDKVTATISIVQSGSGRSVLWDHFLINWKVTPLRGAKYEILSTIASFIVLQEELTKLKDFLRDEDELNNPSAISAINAGQINLMWLDKNKEPLKKWLEDV